MRARTLTLSLSPSRGAVQALWRGLAAAAAGAIDRLLRWQELASQRRALLALEPRLLSDIGLSRADAVREAARPFWDDPFPGMPAACGRHVAGVRDPLADRCEC